MESMKGYNEAKDIKLVFIGDPGNPPYFKNVNLTFTAVGKTSIINRYTDDIFSEGTQTTLGAMFVPKDIVKDDTKYELKVSSLFKK